MGKTSSKIKNAWNAKNYTIIRISLPIQEAERYKKICTESGITLSKIPKKAIQKFINEN